MPVSKEYLAYVVDQLSCIGAIEQKRLFGGMGFYFDGLFFGFIDDDVVYLKVDDQTRERYRKAGSIGFDPYKDGRQSLSYFALPVEVLEDQDELRVWAREAIEVARRKGPSKRASAKRTTKAPARSTKAAGVSSTAKPKADALKVSKLKTAQTKKPKPAAARVATRKLASTKGASIASSIRALRSGKKKPAKKGSATRKKR